MKLIVDMNLSRKWVPCLTMAGVEAVHWTDVGAVNTPDVEIMAFARTRGMAILTRDLDFGGLLAMNQNIGPSIIQLRGGDSTPEVSGAFVVSAIRQFHVQIQAGALVTLNLSRARVRVLPITEV